MNKKTNVMLVEDHPEYRKVIELALEDEPGINLVNQVGSSERALRILSGPANPDSPDLILLDLNLPGKSGLEALPELRSIRPGIHIIILTQSNNESDVLQAIQLGASGYLLKSSTVDQIVDAIRSVAGGGAMLDSRVAKFILDQIQKRLPLGELKEPLSHRELEILSMIGDGDLKKDIAKRLDISINSVATYVRRIYEKLDVQNGPEAIAKAFRTGILPHDTSDDSGRKS